MTRARALKQTIRARAAKTGERYTTARRHVLNQMDRLAPAPQTAPAVVTTPPRPAATESISSGGRGISDARTRARTGHGLDHWFTALDAFGAVEKGHTAAARYLREVHGVDSWYAQGITVAYERARGVRAVNQRRSGEYEVSVSKVMPGDVATVIGALTQPRQQKRWMAGAGGALVEELTHALSEKTSKGFVIRPNGHGRFRYRAAAGVVEFSVQSKIGKPGAPDRVSVVVQHAKLLSERAVAECRAGWKAALNALAGYLQLLEGRRAGG